MPPPPPPPPPHPGPTSASASIPLQLITGIVTSLLRPRPFIMTCACCILWSIIGQIFPALAWSFFHTLESTSSGRGLRNQLTLYVSNYDNAVLKTGLNMNSSLRYSTLTLMQTNMSISMWPILGICFAIFYHFIKMSQRYMDIAI